jgi:hypothetical protein
VEQASKHRVLPSSAPNEGMEPTLPPASAALLLPIVTTLIKDATITPVMCTEWDMSL